MTWAKPAQADESAPAAPRERGWRRLLPALALFLLVPAVPQLRALVPIEQTLLLVVPALAACSWLGWRQGGQIWLALAWTALAAWVFVVPIAGRSEYAALARGWGLILAAAFAGVGLIARTRPFFARALGATAIALAVCGLALGISGAGPRRLTRVVAAELADRVESSVVALRARTQTPEWAELQERNPEGAEAVAALMDGIEAQLRQFHPVGTTLLLAILAFESIAALGLAWSLYHRLSRARLGPPLARLREFRFDDQLIWGVVVGLVLALLPSLADMRGVGYNLLVFFGVLYGLRGLGVLVWFLVVPGRWVGLAVVALLAVLWPLQAIPVGVGLGDTWYDFRRRVRPSNQGTGK